MTLRTGWMKLALCAVLLATAMTPARAQETSGSISGTITDKTGAAIKGATVVLTNTDRGQDVRTITTDSAGFYAGTSLPLGTYTIKVSDAGFKSDSVTGLVLHTSDALTVNRTLVAGNAGETVTVTADSVQLNLENGMSEGLITGTQLRELVLNNRNYEQLLLLQPGVSFGGANDQLYVGVSLPAGTSNQVAFSVGGGRPTSNNWTIDGADNVDRGANLTLLTFPSVDAISEFKTLRGTYLAEYGRSAAGQVNVVTKSGTSAFHGSLYEFFRNDIFNANRYFNKLSSVARPKLRYNDFGGTIGGPLSIPRVYSGKDKTFFFFSYEGRRVINYAGVNVLVPTAAERLGDFSNAYTPAGGGATGPVAVCQTFSSTGACTAYTTKLTSISPVAQSYLQDIYGNVPLPNSAVDLTAGLDPHTLVTNQRNVFNDDQFDGRIDETISNKLSVFYRYLHDTFPSTEAGGLFVGGGLPGVQTTSTSAPGTQHLGHLTYIFSPHLLMDLGYAYSNGAVLSKPIGLASKTVSTHINPGLPFAQSGTSNFTLGIIPTISFNGFATGISNAGIYDDHNWNHNAFGDVTWVLGVHTLKAGVTYNHYEKTENALGNGSPFPQGSFGFTTATAPTASQLTALGAVAPTSLESTFANFLIGNVNNGFTQGSIASKPDVNENLFEGYVQDTWRMTPRLTVNLGVRYSYFGQPTDSANLLSNFDPDTYVAGNAPVVNSNGSLCRTGTCTNLTTSAPNPNSDYLNGIILGTPGANGHASPFGKAVGSTAKNNFAPRVGFAFDVFGNGKTAFRGGYGIAYDDSQVSIYETNAFTNLPYVTILQLGNTTLDSAGVGTASFAFAPSLSGSPTRYNTPYTHQYSLDVQQQITPSLILDVGYLGALGIHLQGKVDMNTLQPGSFAQARPGAPTGLSPTAICSAGFTSQTCEQQLNQIRPYPGYSALNVVKTSFSNNYNGLLVKVTKKFSGKSYIDANYTWSRDLTNAQADYTSGPQNYYNPNGDYGRAVYDRTNIIAFDGIYELPFYRDQKGIIGHVVGGWELSGLYLIDSGLPLTVSASGGGTIFYGNASTGGVQTSPLGLANGGVVSDAAGLGILGPSAAGLRPNMVSNPNNGNGNTIHTRLNWFNRTAFVAPTVASLQVGNEKRGVIEGPGFNRLDIGIFRNFKITESVVLQLRGEAYNIVNHTNWQAVGTTSTTASTFGQVTETRDPRIMQVAGKITF